MEEEVNIYDFSTPVHRVLLEPGQLLGIGMIPAIAILVLTILMVNLVSIWCFPVGIILFIAARLLCKKDPFMLSILF